MIDIDEFTEKSKANTGRVPDRGSPIMRLALSLVMLFTAAALSGCALDRPIYLKVPWITQKDVLTVMGVGSGLLTWFLYWVSLKDAKIKGRWKFFWCVFFYLTPFLVSMAMSYGDRYRREHDPKIIQFKKDYAVAKAKFEEVCAKKSKYEIYESVKGVDSVIYGPAPGDDWDEYVKANKHLPDAQPYYPPYDKYRYDPIFDLYTFQAKALGAPFDNSGPSGFEMQNIYTKYLEWGADPVAAGVSKKMPAFELSSDYYKCTLNMGNGCVPYDRREKLPNYGIFYKAIDLDLREQTIAGISAYAYQVHPFKIVGQLTIYKFDEALGKAFQTIT